MNYTLKELVTGKTVNFIYYQDSNLWYQVQDTTFTFPVPIYDCGSARFTASEKAPLMMRWIGSHLKTLQENKNV